MRAKCIRDCFDNKTAILFRTTGGPTANGIYDIDPSAIYSPHFRFDDKEAQKVSDAVAAKQRADRARAADERARQRRIKAAEQLAEMQSDLGATMKPPPSVSEDKPEDLQAQIERARAENARLKRNG